MYVYTLPRSLVKGHLLVILAAPARADGAADGARRGRGGGLTGAEKSFFPKNNSEIWKMWKKWKKIFFPWSFVKKYFLCFLGKGFFCDFFQIFTGFVKGPLQFPDLLRALCKKTCTFWWFWLPRPAQVGRPTGPAGGAAGGSRGSKNNFPLKIIRKSEKSGKNIEKYIFSWNFVKENIVVIFWEKVFCEFFFRFSLDLLRALCIFRIC